MALSKKDLQRKNKVTMRELLKKILKNKKLNQNKNEDRN